MGGREEWGGRGGGWGKRGREGGGEGGEGRGEGGREHRRDVRQTSRAETRGGEVVVRRASPVLARGERERRGRREGGVSRRRDGGPRAGREWCSSKRGGGGARVGLRRLPHRFTVKTYELPTEFKAPWQLTWIPDGPPDRRHRLHRPQRESRIGILNPTTGAARSAFSLNVITSPNPIAPIRLQQPIRHRRYRRRRPLRPKRVRDDQRAPDAGHSELRARAGSESRRSSSPTHRTTTSGSSRPPVRRPSGHHEIRRFPLELPRADRGHSPGR